MALGDAGVEARNVLCSLDGLEPGLFVLEVASVCAVVHDSDHSLNLEGLVLEALAALAEELELVHKDCVRVGCVHFM